MYTSQPIQPRVLPHSIYQHTYQTISEIVFDSHSEFNKAEAIEKILSTLADQLFLNMGRVLLPDYNETHLCIRYAHGIPKEKRLTSYGVDQGITGLVYTCQQSIYADDLDTNSMYVGKLCASTDLPYTNPAITGVPILDTHCEIKGVLCVNHGYRERDELADVQNVLENTAILIAMLLSRTQSEVKKPEKVISLQLQ